MFVSLARHVQAFLLATLVDQDLYLSIRETFFAGPLRRWE